MLSHFLLVKDTLLLRFTPQTTGMTWREYINLYCAGSKQIFMHETAKYPLQFGPAAQASNQSKCFAQSTQIQNMRIALQMSYVADICCTIDLVSSMQVVRICRTVHMTSLCGYAAEMPAETLLRVTTADHLNHHGAVSIALHHHQTHMPLSKRLSQ